MILPLEEAKTQLITVNAAIQNLIEGKRISELKVGSGGFQRLLRYQEITIDSLREIQKELLVLIDSYEPTKPKFRTNAHIPMIVTKDIY
jgi:hypothetical protein